MQEILKGVEQGWVRPHVDRTFPLEQAGDAHAYIEARKNIGKVVIVTGKTVGAYAADASIRLNGWTDLADRHLAIGYPRGLKVTERRLIGHVDAKYLQ
jgi:hypothetical protein